MWARFERILGRLILVIGTVTFGGCDVISIGPSDANDGSSVADGGDVSDDGADGSTPGDDAGPSQGEPVPDSGTADGDGSTAVGDGADSNGHPPDTTNPDEPVPSDQTCEVRTSPFKDNEFWILTSGSEMPESPFLNIMGRGLTIDNIDVYQGGADGSGCSSTSVDADVSFDGTMLRINATLSNSPMGAFGGTFEGPCTLELVGTVADCGTSESFFADFHSFEVTFSGSVVVGDASVDLPAGELQRIQFRELIPCDESPRTLEGLSWFVTNIDLSTIGIPIMGETNAEVSLDIAGFGNEIDFADLVSLPSEGDDHTGVESDFIACSGTPMERVVFDGQSLVLDITFGEIPTLPTDDDSAPVSNGDDCRVQFNGAVRSCENLPFPAPFGGPETSLTIITLEGVGSYASGNQRGRLNTLFLILTPSPEDTGAEPGTAPTPEVPISPPPP